MYFVLVFTKKIFSPKKTLWEIFRKRALCFFAKKDSPPFAETKNPNDFLIKKKERLSNRSVCFLPVSQTTRKPWQVRWEQIWPVRSLTRTEVASGVVDDWILKAP